MSDSYQFRVTISGPAQAALKNLDPAVVLPRLARTMDKQNQLSVARIQRSYMSGPTTAQSLSVRTSRLRGSIRATACRVTPVGLESAIGSNVVYAAIHEFGGIIYHPARAGKVRLRTDAKGQLLRQGGSGHLAIFAAGHHKRAKEVAYQGKAYEQVMPERRPVRHGIEDRAAEYSAAFSETILKTK
ncbi:MAG: hypothetical protein WCS42_03610 [Verrucomicrobiota bacterium]